MEINDKIKKHIFRFWKTLGIETGENFFTQFGIDIGQLTFYDKEDFIDDLIFEYYGGPDKILEKLNRLRNKVIEYEDEYGGIRFKIVKFSYDKGDMSFYYDAIVDGDTILLDEEGKETTTYELWLEEGLDREFSGIIEETIFDVVYDRISDKLGLHLILENFKITKPGEFKYVR